MFMILHCSYEVSSKDVASCSSQIYYQCIKQLINQCEGQSEQRHCTQAGSLTLIDMKFPYMKCVLSKHE